MLLIVQILNIMNTNDKYIENVQNFFPISKGDYPKKFVTYLFNRFGIKKEDKLLELGAGRGEFLKEFIELGVNGYAIDLSKDCQKLCPTAEINTVNLEKEKLPYPDNYFDCIYSKSFIEHLYYPENVILEIYRTLKPGGKVITLTPSWKHQYKMFYNDFSHRTPFNIKTLKYLYAYGGLKNAKVELFKQLPIIWKKDFSNNWLLLLLSEITRIFLPTNLKKYSKWVRFSKEILVLGYAEK